MNDYDTKPIVCFTCKTPIGEMDYDALIIRPLCGKCASPMPEGDKIMYMANQFRNNPSKLVQIAH